MLFSEERRRTSLGLTCREWPLGGIAWIGREEPMEEGMKEGNSPGLDRLQALLAWWGLSAADRSNDVPPLAAAAAAIATLQSGYCDAFSRNLDAMFTAHDRLSSAAAALWRAKTMAELSQVQDGIFNALAEAAATHSASWSEFQSLLIEVLGKGRA